MKLVGMRVILTSTTSATIQPRPITSPPFSRSDSAMSRVWVSLLIHVLIVGLNRMPFECFSGLDDLEYRLNRGNSNTKDARELLQAVNTVVEGTSRLERRKQWTGNLSAEDMADYERRLAFSRYNS